MTLESQIVGNRIGPVCLVEANFRSPVLPDPFGTTNQYDLTDVILEKGPIVPFAKLFSRP